MKVYAEYKTMQKATEQAMERMAALERRVVEEISARQRLESALGNVVRHWNEFGPEHGFEEAIHHAEQLLPKQQ